MKTQAVLFVDDEENILSALRRGLMEEPYLCKYASSGESALKLFEEYEISVIVTDMRMPKMNGLELLKIVKETYPDTVKIVLTGYIHLPQILATINHVDVFKFITKPWNMEDEFIPIIRQAIEFYGFIQEKKKAKESMEKRFISYQNILHSVTSKTKKIEQNAHYVQSLNETYLSEMKRAIEVKEDDMTKLSFEIFELFYKRFTGRSVKSNDLSMGENLKNNITLFLTENSYDKLVDIKWDIEDAAILNSSHMISYQIITTTMEILIKLVGLERVNLEFLSNQGASSFYQNVCKIKLNLNIEELLDDHLCCAMRFISKIADKENLLVDQFENGIVIKI